MLVQPYLFLDGRCEEALAFYRKALGTEVEMMMRFKESPDPAMVPPDGGDGVCDVATSSDLPAAPELAARSRQHDRHNPRQQELRQADLGDEAAGDGQKRFLLRA